MSIRHLSDQNPDGTVMGAGAGDRIAFYGATPVAQAGAIASTAGTASTTANAVNAILTALRNLGLVAS
ncbi:hypothetical protein ACFOGJ_28750 [Marinibaculum pumilum]|uniref:Head fiber protein n=1 Tax=Marinibaculum pumilum TaxID=1766165 RepID=A0ABV7LAN6_9PROT